MFLKELYKHSKTGCFIVVAFLLAFIYINFKWGVVAAPVFQYGMYSSPFHIKDTQEVYRVTINQKTINCGELSFVDRDIIQLSLDDYRRHTAVNATVYHTMHRFLGFTSLMNYDKYNDHLCDSVFTSWYKSKLEKITGYPVDSLSVFKQDYVWQQNSLQPVCTPIKLNFIVP